MLDHVRSAQMGTKWVQNSRQFRQHGPVLFSRKLENAGLSRRRSRVRVPSLPSFTPKRPANWRLLLPIKARTTAGLYFHPAYIPHGNRRRKPAIAADSRDPDD